MAKFRTRARAIDLLGRQQIAGIPTAINELYKNAHDAYADNVEVDFFENENLLVLRDDGLGMTEDDFLNRWLVLGTESKVKSSKLAPPPVPTNKLLRPILGEKGIGRLSVGAIGKQVLIITRAKRDNGLQKTVMAFIHWGIFELPGLDLEHISVPVRIIDTGMPTAKDISSMLHEIRTSIKELVAGDLVEEEKASLILDDINTFVHDPTEICDSTPSGLSLVSHEGTQFYISSVSSSLSDYLSASQKSRGTASKLEKMLIGFNDTMTPNHPTPLMNIAFRYYSGGQDTYEDIIDSESFFTTDDFSVADHHFKGEFDETGQFNGTITVYGKHQIQHSVKWSGNNFNVTKCGPFDIEIAYIQGKLDQTKMDPIDHSRIMAKLTRFGGLYIYKNNVRILPYGDTDYDFLDIESNRTKSASYYFFSYRRMFGVINIDQDRNSNLTEKAGREGFIENKAYKQLRQILKNFFEQLAADFFREEKKGGSGVYNELWETIREERKQAHLARKRRAELASTKKAEFSKSLSEFFKRRQQKYYSTEIKVLIDSTVGELRKLSTIIDHEKAANILLSAEKKCRKEITKLQEEAKVSAPRGFSATKEQRQDWEACRDEYERLTAQVFLPAFEELSNLITEAKEEYNIDVSDKKRIIAAVEELALHSTQVTNAKKKVTREIARKMSDDVRRLTSKLMIRLRQSIDKARKSFSSVSTNSTESLEAVIQEIEAPIIREKNFAIKTLETMVKQIESIYWIEDDMGPITTNQDVLDSLEEEVHELQQKMYTDAELIQLGLGVNIIHHEFGKAIKGLRTGIRKLKNKADVDSSLQVAYNNISANFAHLDQYLALLTPFSRRILGKEETFPLKDIHVFLNDVFLERLKRHRINLVITKNFAHQDITSHRSVLYPVFVNIVDNAIHWLNQTDDLAKKTIRLHVDKDGTMYISNNGPEISIQDKVKIFQLHFSRKENGRGIGLSISRDILKRWGYELKIGEPRKDCNTTFVISPLGDQ